MCDQSPSIFFPVVDAFVGVVVFKLSIALMISIKVSDCVTCSWNIRGLTIITDNLKAFYQNWAK
jgi:hypothetical protein